MQYTSRPRDRRTGLAADDVLPARKTEALVFWAGSPYNTRVVGLAAAHRCQACPWLQTVGGFFMLAFIDYISRDNLVIPIDQFCVGFKLFSVVGQRIQLDSNEEIGLEQNVYRRLKNDPYSPLIVVQVPDGNTTLCGPQPDGGVKIVAVAQAEAIELALWRELDATIMSTYFRRLVTAGRRRDGAYSILSPMLGARGVAAKLLKALDAMGAPEDTSSVQLLKKNADLFVTENGARRFREDIDVGFACALDGLFLGTPRVSPKEIASLALVASLESSSVAVVSDP